MLSLKHLKYSKIIKYSRKIVSESKDNEKTAESAMRTMKNIGGSAVRTLRNTAGGRVRTMRNTATAGSAVRTTRTGSAVRTTRNTAGSAVRTTRTGSAVRTTRNTAGSAVRTTRNTAGSAVRLIGVSSVAIITLTFQNGSKLTFISETSSVTPILFGMKTLIL